MDDKKPFNPALRALQLSGKTLLQGAVELLLFFPVLLWSYELLSPISFIPWILAISACYALGYWIAASLRIRRAAIFYAVVLIVAALLALAMHGGAFDFRLAGTWLLMSVPLYRGAMMQARKWSDLFPNLAYVVGLLSYFAASFFTGAESAWHAYAPLIIGLGLISLALMLFMTNKLHLRRSAPAGFGVSASVSSRNWVWLALLYVAILAVSYFSVIGRALSWIARLAAYLVGWLVALVVGDGVAGMPPITGGQPPQMHEEIPHEKTFWDTLLEFGTWALLIILLAVAAGAIGYGLYKAIRALIRKLARAYADRAGSGGYVDEKKRLHDLPERSKWGSRLRKRFGGKLKREPSWEQLADWQQRVRWLYRRRLAEAKKNGFEPKPHLTPKETLRELGVWEKRSGYDTDERLEAHYGAARYGSRIQSADDAEIAELKKRLDGR